MVASSFAHALALTLKFEGGYSNDPKDPGGATNMGITQSALARLKKHKITDAHIRSLSLQEASVIYRKHYWNAILGDEMPAGVDICLFDCAVNSGPQRAIKILQSSLGIKKTGILTSETLTATQRALPQSLIKILCHSRLSFLKKLTTYLNFGRGWNRRVCELETQADLLASSVHIDKNIEVVKKSEVTSTS